MKNQHYYFYLTENERLLLIQSLVSLRNRLIEQNKYTDAVDDVLCIDEYEQLILMKDGTKIPIGNVLEISGDEFKSPDITE